ncbi:MAG: tetratricopeptide repeat protein [Candidatus Aminicenantes bacterium]|nr:MAG: tetratricopeptide repeat protein [Candidatus Aminicenantes bacterium]
MRKPFVRRKVIVTKRFQNQQKSSEKTPPGRLSKIEKFFKSILTITVVLIAFIILGIFIVESLRDVIIVESFEIPQELIDKGYSKEALLNKIGDHLYEMNQTIHNKYREKQQLSINLNTSIAPPSLEIPSTDININSLIHFFRNVIGSSPRRVRIEIVLQDKDRIKLTVRIKNRSTTPYYEKKDIPGSKEEMYTISQIDEVLKEAAIHIASYTEPYLTGVYFTAEEEYDEAIKIAELLLKRDQNFYKLQEYSLKALALTMQKKYQSAEKNFEKAIEFASEKLSKVNIYINWGAVLLEEKKLGEAYEKLQKALQYDPKNARIHYNCGVILAEQGKDKEAIKKFQQAIDIDKNYAEAYFLLGVVYGNINDNRKAIKYITEAHDLGHKDPQIYIYLAWAYYGLQDYENACLNLRQLKELNKITRNQLILFISALMKQKRYGILEHWLKCIEHLIQKEPQLEKLRKIAQEEVEKNRGQKPEIVRINGEISAK